MKIFVTVGNTRFDSLFKALDELADCSKHSFLGQIADGHYKPRNFEFFSFSDNISTHISSADAVICHAGAGSVYRLLECRKKLIVVFNTDRVDEHQRDLARFVESESLGLVCWDLSNLAALLQQLPQFEQKEYVKDEFHQTQNITNYLFDCSAPAK